MLVVKFGGGLGNQLFQYAFLLTLKEMNPDTEILCDVTGYEYFNEHNGFEIPKFFSFSEKIMNTNRLKRFRPILFSKIRRGKQCSSLKEYNRFLMIEKVHILLRKKLKKIDYTQVVDHGSLMYNPGAVNKFDGGDYYFDGGWQSPYYYDFDFLRDKILFDISFNDYEKEIFEQLKCTDSVSVHIRRGDFISNGRAFDLCSVDYYKAAINYLVETLNLRIEQLNFFFFSDDHDFVEENFNLPDMRIVRGQSSGHDMYLMSNAKYNIIANSTFSFWGAVLNRKPELVIAPKYFVNLGGIFYKLDAPLGWISLDNIR